MEDRMSKRTALDGYEPSEFERSLLASAGTDGPTPTETERAWLVFEAEAGALATLALPRTAPSAPRPWSGAPRAQALKWLLIGALGGGSLVALWRPFGASLVPPPLPVGVPMVAPAPEHLALAEIPVGTEPAREAAATSAARVEAAAPTRVRATGPRPRSPSAPRMGLPPVRNDLAPESRLAREVAALDAARAALSIGANARALRQIEQYHREFPGGALEADADVVAIEAWAAEGDQFALARAVQRFLRLRPRDPHAARVRELEAAVAARGAAPSR